MVPFAEHVCLCALKNFLLDCAICSNSCLCDGWGKYSGILNCSQEASGMGGKFAVLSLHTFCRAALSCFFFQILHLLIDVAFITS